MPTGALSREDPAEASPTPCRHMSCNDGYLILGCDHQCDHDRCGRLRAIPSAHPPGSATRPASTSTVRSRTGQDGGVCDTHRRRRTLVKLTVRGHLLIGVQRRFYLAAVIWRVSDFPGTSFAMGRNQAVARNGSADGSLTQPIPSS